MQGIYDAVGDKIREIFHHANVNIRIYDTQTNLIHYPYAYRKEQRITIGSSLLPATGFGPHVLRTRETLVINENMAQEIEKYGSYMLVPGVNPEKSAVYVPLVAGDQARGLIKLFDMNREHAFSASDVRLLQTVASAMSVALENARLFDETQRLFKESEQRAADPRSRGQQDPRNIRGGRGRHQPVRSESQSGSLCLPARPRRTLSSGGGSAAWFHPANSQDAPTYRDSYRRRGESAVGGAR
jgi:GAF domain-containing protein